MIDNKQTKLERSEKKAISTFGKTQVKKSYLKFVFRKSSVLRPQQHFECHMDKTWCFRQFLNFWCSWWYFLVVFGVFLLVFGCFWLFLCSFWLFSGQILFDDPKAAKVPKQFEFSMDKTWYFWKIRVCFGCFWVFLGVFVRFWAFFWKNAAFSRKITFHMGRHTKIHQMLCFMSSDC